MPKTKMELVDLINDSVCRQVMRTDGVQPTELFNMMRAVHPVIGGGKHGAPLPDEPESRAAGCERRQQDRQAAGNMIN